MYVKIIPIIVVKHDRFNMFTSRNTTSPKTNKVQHCVVFVNFQLLTTSNITQLLLRYFVVYYFHKCTVYGIIIYNMLNCLE